MYTVLLAETDPILRITYVHFLEEAGAQVFAARNGAEAYRLCESVNPDLVIACMHLPMNDSREQTLIGALHDGHPDIPVIALGTTENETMSDQARRMGAVCLIQKSADGAHLARIAADFAGEAPGRRPDLRFADAEPVVEAVAG